ncbi:deoxyribodipyrimidine photo-lyase [Saccharopolyspora halophila]|uniref:Deoxyribodipyrimidine photo-lyase n=1 Tax=Saccharopolyspora halophila TaxID=405551 RepID=A0ABN3GQN6_9PSEU
MNVAVALFTRDLRVHDNPVLHAAAGSASRVIPLFVLDDSILRSQFTSPNRAEFLTRSLRDLDRGLRQLGAPLVVRRGDPLAVLRRLAAEQPIDEVHLAADVSGYAQRRQETLVDGLPVRVHVHEGSVNAVPPGAVTPTGGNDHFAVFGPYLRRWLAVERRRPLAAPKRLEASTVAPGSLPEREEICSGEVAPELAVGGERAGRELLDRWVGELVDDYPEGHDDLAGDRTSRLSPHLHFGTLSPVEVVHRAGSRTRGAQEFVRQVAWRDFHHQVLAARPRTAGEDYRPRGDAWREEPEELRRWQEGRTGYPIVDAGMRQLLREGWMHNRARMITASFLVKTLHHDWRSGARHFLRHLVDGDVANNQMNWQWTAGTGTDTRPNRVLNPLRQAQRYDPGGDYVRRYLPELRSVPGAAVHEPWKLAVDHRRSLNYPDPMVDLDEGRSRFLEARLGQR